jgi:hypothetical protein
MNEAIRDHLKRRIRWLLAIVRPSFAEHLGHLMR